MLGELPTHGRTNVSGFSRFGGVVLHSNVTSAHFFASCHTKGCLIGHLMANFETFGYFQSAVAKKKLNTFGHFIQFVASLQNEIFI